MPRICLTGVATVAFRRIIEIPDDELEEFIRACDEDPANIEVNLDPDEPPGMRIDSWEELDYKVL